MPASDKNLFDQFAVLGIQTTTVRHSPMFTVEDGEKLLVDVPGGHCKTLFLKDKKRVHVWHDDCIYISEGKKSSLKYLIWRATK